MFISEVGLFKPKFGLCVGMHFGEQMLVRFCFLFIKVFYSPTDAQVNYLFFRDNEPFRFANSPFNRSHLTLNEYSVINFG